MLLILSLIFSSLAIALALTNTVNRKIVKSNIDRYLDQNKQSKLEKLNQLVAKFGREHQQELEQKLVDAGIYNKQLAKYYFPLKFGLILISAALIMFSDMTNNHKAIIGLLLMITILIVPDMLLAMRKKTLILKTSRQLPYMLDMMSVCVQTGMTIEASLAYLGQELESFDKDLCYQIRKTYDASRIHGLEKALYDLSERIPTAEVRSFTLTLIQNLQYGTSIANVLSDLAEDIRKMQVLVIEEKIGKLSAKMSIPLILFIMFPIVILILAPGIMQMSMNIG